jgi:glycosyltransferase involved in cell wall biosynthesis
MPKWSKEEPTLSVIILTYNRANLIGQAILSILGQTFTSILQREKYQREL